MRLTAINCILMACAAVALASGPRPKRHLHQIKEMIANKLFGSSAPPPQIQKVEPDVQFFKIPGFDSVVIKAVPKGSEIEPPPIIEKIPPNSHIGIIGSYLGTNSVNETHNALLGVNNLMTSGILDDNHAALPDLLQPSKTQYVVSRPVSPCAKAEFIGKPGLDPIRFFVKPPKVPELVPTQYSYKQVNQDGSLTSYTSSLDLSSGVKVTEEGKTLPFFIDRMRKIPVRLPVPVLPEISNIHISNPINVGYGPYPTEIIHPGSSYSYKQLHHDGKVTTYTDMPSFNPNHNGVVVTETGKKIPPPPLFIMDRVEKVAAIASFPKVPFIDFIESRPMAIDVPAGHVMYSAPVFQSPVHLSAHGDYAYRQVHGNGGKPITHVASGFVKNPAVLVTEHKLASTPYNTFPIPMNPDGLGGPGSTSFSYNQVHSGGKVTKYTGADVKEYDVNSGASGSIAIGAQAAHRFKGIPPAPNTFSYKQVGNGKMTTYTGTGIARDGHGVGPAVIAQSVRHPVPPPHLTDRIEKVAAGAKFNRPPISSTPLVSGAFPVPASFVRVPSIQPIVPQRPVKIPSASSTSPFVYKHIHSDGSVTSFGGDGLINSGEQAPMEMAIPPSYQRVYESPIYTGPFPVNVNSNAVKPSTPFSGSYSYKLINNGQFNSEGNGHIGGYQSHVPSEVIASNKPFPMPSVSAMAPAPVQGCVDPEVINPSVGPSAVMFKEPVPLSYTYKQINHNQPNPFLVVNVEDPVMGAKQVNTELSHNSQKQIPNVFPAINKDQKPDGYMFVPPVMDSTPIPQAPQVQPAVGPQSSYSYKQLTNQGLYEYSDEFTSGVKTNQPPVTSKPNNAEVYVEKTPPALPSSPEPVQSSRNSLSNNPIVVPEPASLSFKQSNSDGSTITTVMDNGQNSLSVKVEDASKPEAIQSQELPRVNSVSEQGSHAPSLDGQMDEALRTESSPKKKKLRRRVLKRVKNRGDIPDTE